MNRNQQNGSNRSRSSQQNRQPNGAAYRDQSRCSPMNQANSRENYISPEERARRNANIRSQEAYARKREAEQRRIKAEQMRRERLAWEKRQRKIENEERKREFGRNMKIFGGRLLVFAVILVLMVGICVGAFLISLSSTPHKPPSSGSVTYYFGGVKVRSEKVKDVMVGNHVYFCFNDLSEYLEMGESGTADEMKFILPYRNILTENAEGSGNEDSIVFLTDETRIILNGQQVVMKIPNILRGTEVWVSYDFVANFMENISLTYDEDKLEMRISQIKDEAHSTKDLTIYLEPSFVLKSADSIDHIEENPLIGDLPYTPDDGNTSNVYTLSFVADVSAYEEYMDPQGSMRDAFLMLVNEDSPVKADYLPANMCEVKNISIISKTQYLSEYAAKALEALFIELRANQFYNMAVYTGYRSYEDHSTLFKTQVASLQAANPAVTKTKTEENAAFAVGRPGCDDQQTGLAVDMDTFGCVTTDFQYEVEYKWLTENAWKFGFILRYPKDKTEETGHAFEPWHFRFVGRYHARKIHSLGLSLEEYLEQIN